MWNETSQKPGFWPASFKVRLLTHSYIRRITFYKSLSSVTKRTFELSELHLAPLYGGAKCNSAFINSTLTPQIPTLSPNPKPKPSTQHNPPSDSSSASLLGEAEIESTSPHPESSPEIDLVTLVSVLIAKSSGCISTIQVHSMGIRISQNSSETLTKVIRFNIDSGVFQLFISELVFITLSLCRTHPPSAMTKSPPPIPVRPRGAEESRLRSHTTPSSPSSRSPPGLRQLRPCKKKRKNISIKANGNPTIVQQLNKYSEIIISYVSSSKLKLKLTQEYNTFSRVNSLTLTFSPIIAFFLNNEVRRYPIYVGTRGKIRTTEGHCKAMKYVLLNKILGISSVGLEFLRNFLQVAQSFEFNKTVSLKVIDRFPWYSLCKSPNEPR